MENSFSNYILVLPSWYPNKTSPYDGDFIQRHIKAISLFIPQYVIYVVKDSEGKYTTSYKTEISETGNLTEQIIYYNPYKSGIGILDKIIAHIKYKKLYKAAIQNFIKNNAKPKLVHVHIAMKAGIMALWLKKKYNTPYILSEQSTIYLTETDDKLSNRSVFFKYYSKRIINHAIRLTTVSNYLGNAIKKYCPTVKFYVVPNLVQHSIFSPAPQQLNNNATFIHISNFTYQKNVTAIIEAAKILNDKKIKFSINLFGKYTNYIKEYIIQNNLTEVVILKGEVNQTELAMALQQSTALILYSRYETFGCVIIEANACGIPVIVSDIDVFKETVVNNINGCLVEQSNAPLLAAKLEEFINKKQVFNASQIATNTFKYSEEEIGKQFIAIYNSINVE